METSTANVPMTQTGAPEVPPTYEELEAAIRAVPGVAEASIRPGEPDGRGRLRLRLAFGHDPEVVSRRVAGALSEQFGIDIDPAALRPTENGSGEASASTAGDGTEAEDHADDDPAVGTATADAPPADAPPDAGPGTPQPAGVGAGVLSVEQLYDADDAVPDGNGEVAAERLLLARPAIIDLAVANEGLEVHAEAVLTLEGLELRGRADGAATRRATFRSIATATLRAIETLFPDRLKMELETIEVTDERDDARVTVGVTFLTEYGPERLYGVSIIRGDPELATMRATLDAVNRRVGLLLLEQDD